ncbi:MAG TPA: regulatory protein RecX [Chlamydiales bacterium]|nr:regulatory protein RecX [Chlamydiales bacterium]
MAFTLQRSAIDPNLLEVWCESQCIEEIFAPFIIRKIPVSFDSIERVKKWLVEIEWKLARSRAYWLIARRSYASGVLRQKLVEKRFSAAVCDRVIEELEKSGYLNDGAFFEQAILREFRRGYGPKYIEMKLKAQGRKVRELVTPEMQKERIRQLLPKLKGDRQKAMRALFRRGFDLDLIQTIEIFS